MSNNLPILYPSRWQEMPDGRRLPVIEIGHLVPNYRPQCVSTQQFQAPMGEDDVAMPPLEDVAPSQRNVQQDGIISISDDEDISVNDAPRKRPSEADCSDQRSSKKNKKNNGGDWIEKAWNARFEELKKYKEKHKDCNVPTGCGGPYKQLGRWVVNQRTGYKTFMKAKEVGNSCTNFQGARNMTEERITCLEEIGFEWSVQVSWDLRYEELKEYKEKHGNCRVPVTRGPLGKWASNQRQGYRMFMKAKEAGKPTTNCRGTTQDRIRLLEEIGFEWSVQ